MSDSAEVISSSPIDFKTAVAYALHPPMRRLLIIWGLGAFLCPYGLSLFFNAPRYAGILTKYVFGLGFTVGGAVLFFAGLIGALLKVMTDAQRLATSHD